MCTCTCLLVEGILDVLFVSKRGSVTSAFCVLGADFSFVSLKLSLAQWSLATGSLIYIT